MNGHFGKVLSGAAAIALLVLAAPGPASAQFPLTGVVGGGGKAVLDDTFPEFIGATTEFGLGASIRADGTATGNFTCIVSGQGGLVLMMQVTHGVRTGPNTVTLSGPGIVQFDGGGGVLFFDWTLEVQAGGPGVGGFRLFGEGWSFPTGDHETLLSGQINVN